MSRFAERVFLVTGASSGLGRACAQQLESEGARLVLAGRNGQALREAFPDSGHVALECDVRDEDSVRAMISAAKAAVTAVHGAVLAAGAQDIRPLLMESAATLQSTWATNVFGSLGLLAAAFKARLIAKGGSVVLFSSVAARAGGPGLVSYAASKGALEAATRSLALEMASQKIRVNAVAPGVVRTPMSDKYLSKLTVAQVESLEALHPLGVGQPEFISKPVAFLLSDEAQWITGAVLVIDGGFSVR